MKPPATERTRENSAAPWNHDNASSLNRQALDRAAHAPREIRLIMVPFTSTPRPSHDRNCGAVLAICLLFASLPAGGQQAERRLAAPPSSETVEVTTPEATPEVPFELVNNHYVIEASVNGSEPLRLVLDTGMPGKGALLYENDATDEVDLEFDPAFQARVGGAGGTGGTMVAQVANDATLDFAGVRFQHSRVMVIPVPAGFPTLDDGIVGYSFFANFAVEIDHQENVLRLHDPATYDPPTGAAVLPLTFRGNLPYTTIGVSTSGGPVVPAEVVVDLGAGHAISLNDERAEITVPSESLPTVLGRGISGPIDGVVARIAKMKLGPIELTDVVTSFPVKEHQNPRGIDSLAGNLGSETLRRFDTTFDYAGKRMVLVATQRSSEPFRFDRSGLGFLWAETTTVASIIGGSPGAQAGIEIGDVLLTVNGKPAASLGVDGVRAVLWQEGEVTLAFERNGKLFERVLTLRRLI